jgi:mono/diheme cytochrome c family protein
MSFCKAEPRRSRQILVRAEELLDDVRALAERAPQCAERDAATVRAATLVDEIEEAVDEWAEEYGQPCGLCHGVGGHEWVGDSGAGGFNECGACEGSGWEHAP